MKQKTVKLTETEAQIALLVLSGRATRFVCHDRNITESTFRVHIRNIREKIMHDWGSAEDVPSLLPPSYAQITVLKLRAAKKTHEEIAGILGISPLTSQKHTFNGMKRLGLCYGRGHGRDLLPLQKALAALDGANPVSKPINLEEF